MIAPLPALTPSAGELPGLPGLPAGLCDAPESVLVPACQLPLPDGVGAVTGGLSGDLAGSLGDAAMRGLTSFVVDGAVWLLGQVAAGVTSSTEARVQAGWFLDHYRQMTGIAGVVTVGFLLVTAASTLLHRDPARLGRALGMVAAAGVGTGAVLGITDLLLEVSDQMSAAVARGMTGDLRTALTGAADGLTSLISEQPGMAGGVPAAGAGVPLFAALLAGLLAAVAAVVIWIELLLREVALYAVVLFFPLALAGLVWDPARSWARKLAELLAALIFAKFVIVAVLSLAAGGLAAGGQPDGGFGSVLAGAALLVVAAFAPFLLLRVISVMEVAAAATVLEGARQRGTRPLVSGGRTAMFAAGRHGARASAARAGSITVAGAAAPWVAAGNGTASRLRPPLPLRPARTGPASTGFGSARGMR
jgi:hypothetical protein